MKHRKPTGEIELCATCHTNPRRTFSDNCHQCSADIRAEQQRERRAKERETRQPKPRPCKCGCDIPVFAPAQYATVDCKRIGRSVSVKEYNARRKDKAADHPERFGLKPHRPESPPPRKVMSEEEAERLAEEQRRLDAEVNSRLVKSSLGLEVRKDCPLASEVVRPPKEVWKEYEANWKPLTQAEREFNLPLRADISYY